MTMKRERWLRDNGYKVRSIWGCEWREIKHEDPDVFEKVKAMKLPKPLNPRDAFYGGRTETFKILSKQGTRMAYDDVTSLYPWVNSGMHFKEISEYFGLVKCSILPPRKLYVPVLPVHASGKLLFPLCRTCAETWQQESCKHCEEERVIQGTWFSEEMKLALEKGYKMVEIHSVWHFPNTTKHLFKLYMRRFYKLKLLSSKLQCNKENEAEVLAFINAVEKIEGITISSPDDFNENPGLRKITKLMLNNMWGRFGMNENMSTCQCVSDFEELEKLMEDVTREVQGVGVINEKIVQVISKYADADYLPCSRDTNIFIAVATTAWARIRLYQEIEKVGERVLYCNTDSVIYEASENPKENLKLGSFLGEMTSELDDDDYIIEFVSGGPKNYGYVMKKGKTVVKVKGFTLNCTNAEAFSFQRIKEVILNGVSGCVVVNPVTCAKRRKVIQRDEFLDRRMENAEEVSAISGSEGILVFNPVRIYRTRAWEIVQRAEQKLYLFEFNKRVIDVNTCDTFPYGY